MKLFIILLLTITIMLFITTPLNARALHNTPTLRELIKHAYPHDRTEVMEKKDSKKSPEDTKNYVALGNPLPPEDDPTSTPSDQVLDRRGNPVDMVRCVEQASSLYHILINVSNVIFHYVS